MLKKCLLLAVMGVALAGCAGGGVTPDDINTNVKKIQSYTKTICSFVPTVATVAAILSGGASASFGAIATDICNAITTAPLADGGGRHAYVNGVKIRGQFVR